MEALFEQVTCDTFPVHRNKYYNYNILYAIYMPLVNRKGKKGQNEAILTSWRMDDGG
jgi:hypothetical protein